MRISLGSTITTITFTAAILLASSLLHHATQGQSPRGGRPLPARQTPNTGAPSSSGGTKIAVIDISYIYKNHIRFKQMMDKMKQDVEAYEAVLKQQGAMLQSKRQELEEHRPGSDEYKRIEKDMASFQAQMQADTQLRRKEFLQREARIYYDVYQEIVREVTAFSQRMGIDMVVRFNSDNIDPEDRKSVLEGVNRAVVYQSRLNITYDISEALNLPYQSAQRPPATQPR